MKTHIGSSVCRYRSTYCESKIAQLCFPLKEAFCTAAEYRRLLQEHACRAPC